MELRLEREFDEYLKDAQDTMRLLLAKDTAAIRALRLFHVEFRDALWPGRALIPPVSGLLCINAYLMFLSGAHVALNGHAAAIFPLLRTALENACYAFVIAKDPRLESIWLDRHRDERTRAESRAAFTSAVRKTSALIDSLQPGSGGIILESYDAAIDDGAHPNPRGVVSHLSIAPADDDGRVAMSLVALHGPEDFATQKALIACLDFAWVISLVLARIPVELTAEAVRALDRLNAAKEAAIQEFGFLRTE